MNDGQPAAPAAPAATNPANFDTLMQSGGAPEPVKPKPKARPNTSAAEAMVHPGTEPALPVPGAQSKAPIPNLVPQMGKPAPEPEVDEEGNAVDAEDEPAPDGVEAEAESEAPSYDLTGPDLPAELLEKQVTVKVNGKESKVSIDEAAKGYMRTADYTRKTQDVSSREVKVRSAESRINQKFESFCDVRNVPQTLAELRKFGLPMDELAALALQEWQAEQKLTPTERASKAEAKRLREQLEEAHGKLTERDDTSNQQSQEQLAQEWNAIYQKHAPGALAANGLKPTPLTTKLFKEALATLWPQGAPLTPEIIAAAAVSTKEELQDLIADGGTQASAAAASQGKPTNGSAARQPAVPQAAQRPGSRIPPVRGVPGQPGVPGARRGGNIDDFDAKFFR